LLPSVEKALDFNSGISILDIGCGSGIWVMVNKTFFFSIGISPKMYNIGYDY
jgi:cyclopropane fatty-acyl-phospholipid synthase-like methyltransferase